MMQLWAAACKPPFRCLCQHAWLGSSLNSSPLLATAIPCSILNDQAAQLSNELEAARQTIDVSCLQSWACDGVFSAASCGQRTAAAAARRGAV